MKKVIFICMATVAMLPLRPTFARTSEASVPTSSHPISDLIGDWPRFRTAILAKTRRYDKFSDIKPGSAGSLPNSLQGTWQMASSPAKPGYRQRASLSLGPNHKFNYRYVLTAGKSQQTWRFSGQWEEKNRILMLLVANSSYPGVEKNEILFWRLLHVDHAKLLFVRTGADEMVVMTRAT